MIEFKKGDEVLVEASIDGFTDEGNPIVKIEDPLKGASHLIVAKLEMLRYLSFDNSADNESKSSIFTIQIPKEEQESVGLLKAIIDQIKEIREELREGHEEVSFDDKVNACETLTQKETDLYYFIHLSKSTEAQESEQFDGDFQSLFEECMESVIELTTIVVNTKTGKRPLINIKTL